MSDAGANFDNTDFVDSTNVDDITAGKTVCFSETSITADLTLLFDIALSMTFELYVKTRPSPLNHGVIFSYAGKKTFAVWNLGTVVITYDTFIWDTGLTLEDNKWNQISLVWTKKLYALEVYLFHSKDDIGVARPSEPLPKPNPFRPGGKLTLGRWQPSSADSGTGILDHFVGCIDELRIWQK